MPKDSNDSDKPQNIFQHTATKMMYFSVYNFRKILGPPSATISLLCANSWCRIYCVFHLQLLICGIQNEISIILINYDFTQDYPQFVILVYGNPQL